jgi:hypothetical protein
MTGLLDVLKEAALDTGLLEAFETSASCVALSKAALDQRLLLCLYGLSTNAGLKRVAGATPDVSYEELLHVHRRFIHAPALREACTRVANATLTIRNAAVWGDMQIAERLGRGVGSAHAAIAAIEPLVDELDRYQFVSSPTPAAEVIKALRAAAKALSGCDVQISEDIAAALKSFIESPKKDDFAALSTLEALEQQMRRVDQTAMGPAGEVVAKLIKVGWRGLFMMYYQLKDQRKAEVAAS